ncbi:MAG: hypothetical protein IKO83_01650 [Oscillospiraceae bacterium]|nr:hypothetical protein [Oscillospiraceae bacterium]MBR4548607.1 hypothetical protein [Oscillospiraceae bacterium]
MTYFKETNGGYILAIGTDTGGEEITEAEYDEIMAVIQTKPARTETTDYRLKADLTWEPYEVEPPDPDPELDGDDVLEILLGGAE